MSSLFHKMKKMAVGGESQPDTEFQEAKQQFDAYHESLIKLKAHLVNYSSHASGVLLSGSAVCLELTTLLEKGPAPAQQQADMIASARKQHTVLAQQQNEKINARLTKLSNQVDEHIKFNVELQQRIVERNKANEELAYYTKKMHELTSDKESRASKGKSESQSDIEKYDRNQKKLSEVQTAFSELNNKLLADFSSINSKRAAHFAPICSAFVQEETHFVEVYATALNEIKTA